MLTFTLCSGVYLPDTPSAYQKEIGFDDATAIEVGHSASNTWL